MRMGSLYVKKPHTRRLSPIFFVTLDEKGRYCYAGMSMWRAVSTEFGGMIGLNIVADEDLAVR
jgi:hypothetical protein